MPEKPGEVGRDSFFEIRARDEGLEATMRAYSRENAKKLRDLSVDRPALGARGCGYEKLDQLTIEVLLGVR